MKKTRELKGMPVLALQEGERLGQVRELILDPVARQVVALILDRRVGGEDQIVATANIRNVGPAAITVEDRSSLIPLSRIARFQELARLGKAIQGKVVMSEAGERLGQVDDLEVDVETFGLASLVLKAFLRRGQVIPAEQVRTIGADAIVVRVEPPEEAAPEPVPSPTQEPAPPPSPIPVEEPSLVEEPISAPAEAPGPPLEEPVPAPEEFVPTPVEAPAPPPTEEPVSTLAPEEGVPPPEPPAPPPAEEPQAAEVSPPEPDMPPAEGPVEEGENAWQRWVRRLKGGD